MYARKNGSEFKSNRKVVSIFLLVMRVHLQSLQPLYPIVSWWLLYYYMTREICCCFVEQSPEFCFPVCFRSYSCRPCFCCCSSRLSNVSRGLYLPYDCLQSHANYQIFFSFWLSDTYVSEILHGGLRSKCGKLQNITSNKPHTSTGILSGLP